MRYQLRTYRVREGDMAEFVALWRDHVVPARRAHGFEVVGAWNDAETGEFTWIVGHPSPEGFAAADAAYYASAERAALPRDPKDFLESVDARVLDAVPYSP
jgi:hypothetical protein